MMLLMNALPVYIFVVTIKQAYLGVGLAVFLTLTSFHTYWLACHQTGDSISENRFLSVMRCERFVHGCMIGGFGIFFIVWLFYRSNPTLAMGTRIEIFGRDIPIELIWISIVSLRIGIAELLEAQGAEAWSKRSKSKENISSTKVS